MANLIDKKYNGQTEESPGVKEGQVVFDSNSGRLYIDIDDSTRRQVTAPVENGFQLDGDTLRAEGKTIEVTDNANSTIIGAGTIEADNTITTDTLNVNIINFEDGTQLNKDNLVVKNEGKVIADEADSIEWEKIRNEPPISFGSSDQAGNNNKNQNSLALISDTANPNYIEGKHSVALGAGATIKGNYSFSAGAKATVNEDYSLVAGLGNISNRRGETVFGSFNNPTLGGVLTIGGGSSKTNRNNAMTIDQSGNVFLGEMAECLCFKNLKLKNGKYSKGKNPNNTDDYFDDVIEFNVAKFAIPEDFDERFQGFSGPGGYVLYTYVTDKNKNKTFSERDASCIEGVSVILKQIKEDKDEDNGKITYIEDTIKAYCDLYKIYYNSTYPNEEEYSNEQYYYIAMNFRENKEDNNPSSLLNSSTKSYFLPPKELIFPDYCSWFGYNYTSSISLGGLGTIQLCHDEGKSSLSTKAYVENGQYDNENNPLYYELNTATGQAAAAIGGVANEANGNYSFVTGEGNIAETANLTVVGKYNETVTQNDDDKKPLFIVGSGEDSQNRDNALVIYDNGELSANKLDIGTFNDASGNQAVTLGTNNMAKGNNSLAGGATSKTEKAGSIAFGQEAQANGELSQAFGYQTKANGTCSLASGQGTVAQGNYSLAGGQETIASDTHSLAFGGPVTYPGTPTYPGTDIKGKVITEASGEHSIALGRGVKAEGARSFAAGEQTVAKGEGSVALNVATEAQGTAQTVIGQFNKPNTSDLFIIGNGTSKENTSNALTIDKFGNAKFTGVVESQGKVLATKDYIDNMISSEPTKGKLLKIGNDGKFPIEAIPHGALERCVVVENEEAFNECLKNKQVEPGDTIKRNDNNLMYFVVEDEGQLNAIVYTAGSATSVPWNGVTGKPNTLSGYNINDAYTQSQVDTAISIASNTLSDRIDTADQNISKLQDSKADRAITLEEYGIRNAVSVNDLTESGESNKIPKINSNGVLNIKEINNSDKMVNFVGDTTIIGLTNEGKGYIETGCIETHEIISKQEGKFKELKIGTGVETSYFRPTISLKGDNTGEITLGDEYQLDKVFYATQKNDYYTTAAGKYYYSEFFGNDTELEVYITDITGTTDFGEYTFTLNTNNPDKQYGELRKKQGNTKLDLPTYKNIENNSQITPRLKMYKEIGEGEEKERVYFGGLSSYYPSLVFKQGKEGSVKLTPGVGAGSLVVDGDYVKNNTIFSLANSAKGMACLVAGRENEVGENATASTAFGYKNKVDSKFSTAFGRENEVNNECSIAFGSSNTTSGQYSAVFGFNNEASGNYQLVIGQFNKPSNNDLFIIGNGVGTDNKSNALTVSDKGKLTITSSDDSPLVINGKESNALTVSQSGKLTITSKNDSPLIIIGKGDQKVLQINSRGSLLTGTNNDLVGKQTMDLGGYFYFVNGYNNKVDNWKATDGTTHTPSNFYIFGHNNTISSSNITMFGSYLESSKSNQVIFGKCNATSDQALFIIGNGTTKTVTAENEGEPSTTITVADTRKNAFEVLPDGIKINGSEVLTKQKLEALLQLLRSQTTSEE